METRVEARMMMAVAESPVEVPLIVPAVVAAVPAPGRGRVWLPEERKSETELASTACARRSSFPLPPAFAAAISGARRGAVTRARVR